jgi:hypothetical protein
MVEVAFFLFQLRIGLDPKQGISKTRAHARFAPRKRAANSSLEICSNSGVAAR